ncbi:MAG: hypothetical protein CRN43_18000 [Candidatus Nephrothrix sp. EaCA]|nr:MAG: hypothetical protein CRN43_18000 [Candidatus Nephrothrix sp. EaCA]
MDGEWTVNRRGMKGMEGMGWLAGQALIFKWDSDGDFEMHPCFRIFRNPRIFPIFPKSTQLNPFFRFRPFFPKFIDPFFISFS